MLVLITDRTGGYYNTTDLNRVGEAVQYVADLLNGYGYALTVTPKIDWTVKDIPRVVDMKNYLAYVQAIKNRFYGTTPLPTAMDNLTPTEANNIENLILEIEEHIQHMIARFRPSGTFVAGQASILPRRVT